MSVENSAPPAGNEPTSAPVDPNTVGEGGERAVGVSEEPKNVVQSLADRWKKQRDERGKFVKEKAEKEAAAKAETPVSQPSEVGKEEPKEAESSEKRDEEKGASLRLARALADSKKAQKDALELKAKLEETSKAMESFQADFKKNPLRALEKATGRTFMDIMKEAAAGKFDVQQVPDEIRKELDELKAFRDEERKAREEQATAQQREADNKTVKAFLDARADDYPIFASLDWGVEELREAAYAHLREHGEQPNLGQLAKELEERAAKTLSVTLSQERLVKAIAKDTKVREVLLRALGQQPAAPRPAATAAQPAITNAATQVAAPSAPKQPRATTPLDLDDDQIERWKRFKATGKLD